MHAIAMQEDGDGFLFPVIDSSRCIHCGICFEQCPVQQKEQEEIPPIIFYSGWNNNKFERLNSTSGGIFTLFAQYFFSNESWCIGAVYNNKYHCIQHTITQEITQLPKLMGTKYSQSRLDTIWTPLSECLKNGKKILFVGTPCQIAAIKSVFPQFRTQLFLIELFCMGVPSPGIFRDYILRTEKKIGKIIDYVSRSKDSNGVFSLFITEKGIFKSNIETDPFLHYFHSKTGLRKSCYNCHFRGMRRQGDIVIGDFWNAETIYPKNECGTGISLIGVQTTYGAEMLHRVSSGLTIQPLPTDVALKGNPYFLHSPAMPEIRNTIFINRGNITDFFRTNKWEPSPLRRIYYFIRRKMGHRLKEFRLKNFKCNVTH